MAKQPIKTARQVLTDIGNLSLQTSGKKGSLGDIGRVASTSANVAPVTSWGIEPEAPTRSKTAGADDLPEPKTSPSRQRLQKAPADDTPLPNPRNDMDASEYIDDIFLHFSKCETENLPPVSYMDKQPELTADMRAICLDWIVECANRFKMSPETIFLTANVLDRFLAVKPIQRKRMQMVTMVCLIIAAKYEEIYPPRIKEFIHISADAFTREDMLRYEHSILHALNYTLTVPTPYSFMTRYLYALRSSRPEGTEDRSLRFASHFIAECAMLNLQVYLENLPSLLGAASVHAARVMLDLKPHWPTQVATVCQYDTPTIEKLSSSLLQLAKDTRGGKLQATIRRYSEEKRMSVAKKL